MALVSLATTGPKYLKCLISQNTDGLHRRSGIPVDKLCELHGNTTLEVCDQCGRGYMRDYWVGGARKGRSVHDHKTGRHCTVPKCGGELFDTIINFNEALDEEVMKKAHSNASECDVMLALGSSLLVAPAYFYPRKVGWRWVQEKCDPGPKHNLVIVNLQSTPLDNMCSLRIFAKIDDVMVPLMKELGLEIPEWKLKRFLKIELEPMGQPQNMRVLTISAVDVDGINATVFRDVKLRNNGKAIFKRGAVADSKKSKLRAASMLFRRDVHTDVRADARGEPSDFIFDVASTMVMAPDDGKENENGYKGDDSTGLVAEIEFFGNYREPNLCLPLLSILHPDDTPSNANDQNDNGSNESKGNKCNAQNGPFTINKRPKDDNSPMAKPESKENDNGSFPFVCRLTMDIATRQWTVEQGVKLEEVVKRDQLMPGRGRRDAERAKKAKERR